MLSKKAIPTDERLILALDVPSVEEAKKLVSALGDTVKFYKLGLEIFLAGGYYELIDWLTERGKKCFVDLKFFDVPNTVASAVRQLRGRHPQFVTVHGNDQILRAACDAKNGIKILAVTVLTSLDNADLKALGFQVNAQELVLSRARRALEIGDKAYLLVGGKNAFVGGAKELLSHQELAKLYLGVKAASSTAA